MKIPRQINWAAVVQSATAPRRRFRLRREPALTRRLLIAAPVFGVAIGWTTVLAVRPLQVAWFTLSVWLS
jgi:hypothetical protein